MTKQEITEWVDDIVKEFPDVRSMVVDPINDDGIDVIRVESIDGTTLAQCEVEDVDEIALPLMTELENRGIHVEYGT